MRRLADIWASFRRLPGWVQLWVALILVPVNLASLGFLAAPFGPWIAVLAVGGMLPNAVLMWREAGLSKAMGLPHLLFWVPLLFVLGLALRDGGGPDCYLWLLFAIDLTSLQFDFPDARRWWRGERDVA